MSLYGQLTLVTGASAGIGEATCRLLLKNGSDVILIARREDKLRELKKNWNNEFPERKIYCFNLDISKSDEVLKFVRDNTSVLQKLSHLVNNAGLALGTDPVHHANWKDWEQMIQTNFTGLTLLTHQLLPFLIKNAPAHIVNLGSIAGRWTYPGGAIYSATKFAVRAFSEGLRLDLLGKNIRITNIEPGMVETEFSKVRFAGDMEKASNVYKGLKPLSASDIAENLVWCLQQPAHVNIQEMVIYPTDQASPQHIHRQN